ncbi:MAG: ribosome biogenesis GTPase Der [Firmicutes bacterium]|nr:ribosome biogenesis GTPase Der [Bacillota bacterium]
MSKPIVAIVGRPNVGKSALFNRIISRRLAIVEGTPGVTRDRLYADAEWTGRKFILVDTGGIEERPAEVFSAATRRQAEEAVEEADVIVFTVDAQSGLLPADWDVAELLRRTRKPVIVAANKADNEQIARQAAEFFQLGLSEPIPVSAEHGKNIGDLLDRIVAHLPSVSDAQEPEDEIKIALIGRPNVGKSSLANRLIGEERMIVTDIPGTTRDAIDTVITRDGRTFRLIDTAGMRRRSRIDTRVEHYSTLRAIRAAERSDVCLVVLDATEGVTEQDARVAGIPHEAGKGVVLVVNKWDLVEKRTNTMQEYEQSVRNELGYLSYAPIVFVSARTGQRVDRLLTVAQQVAEQAAMRISTGRLNEVLQEAVHLHAPPSDKGKRLRILYATQVGVQPPHFVLFMNEPSLFHFSYRRYLEARLREAFGFVGTPIIITAKRRGE